MIKSMTGFGAATSEEEGMTLKVEVKTLNSKSLDCSVRIPSSLSELELDIRKKVTERLERGKVVLSTDLTHDNVKEQLGSVNQEAFLHYYKEFNEIKEKNKVDVPDLFSLIINMPGVIDYSSKKDVNEKQISIFLQKIEEAISECDEYRIKEGKEIFDDLLASAKAIEKNLHAVPQYEKERKDNISARLKDGLNNVETEKVDKERFEQEVLYYLEKFDINEEKQRLSANLSHFISVLYSNESSKGKKLGFISQEIGREINTLGAKANHIEIQKLVVVMKEDLEKIKEQIGNVL